MANPNVLAATSITEDILAEAQLISGNNDFVVPTGKAWTVKSIALTNVSGAAVTATVSVIKSGSSARVVVPTQTIAAGDGLVIDPTVVAVLPEAATLRINASAGTAIDAVVTGVVTA